METMNPLTWFAGYKSVVAGVGMMGLGLYQISQGMVEVGLESVMQGLAVIGIRSALAK